VTCARSAFWGGVEITLWEVFRLNRRFWVLTVVGLILTATAAFHAWDSTGAYSGRARIALLAPQQVRGNALVKTTISLIALAGILAHTTGGPGGDAQSVSDDVTLLQEGVTDGYGIRQPNAGGQWEYRFEVSVVDVQSAGPTLDRAQEQMSSALAKISSTLAELQDRAGVAPDQRVSIQLGPGEPVFTYEHGSRMRATLMSAALGVILSFTLPVIYARFGRPGKSEPNRSFRGKLTGQPRTKKELAPHG
jgi:hypothetical protein